MRKLLAVILFSPTMALAEFETGNSLLADLRNTTSSVSQMVALGYVKGVFDTMQHVTHCPPPNAAITAGQIADMARQYLESIPHLRHNSADSLLIELFKKAWPCSTNKRPDNRGV